MVIIFLGYGKHLFRRIISKRGDALTHKACVTWSVFNVPSEESEQVMCICI
jgi:hypothetical protein